MDPDELSARIRAALEDDTPPTQAELAARADLETERQKAERN